MSVFVSHSVVLTYGSTSETFNALFADDEDYEIIRLLKDRIDRTILETIIGYRNIYRIRIQGITSAQRLFLYQFVQSSSQSVTINGSSHNVNLRDTQLHLSYLSGYVGNVELTMEFEDATLTRVTTPSRYQGTTTSSVGYTSTATGVGTVVTLFYDYGSGNTGRTFRVNSVIGIGADIVDKRWEYIDHNNGYKRLGYRLNFEIDFGGFGLGQTQAQLLDDRTWLKEFVLAPSKRVEVYGQYFADVANDFDEVRYGHIGNNIYNKTIQLGFKSKMISGLAPLDPADQLIFDFVLTDENILG